MRALVVAALAALVVAAAAQAKGASAATISGPGLDDDITVAISGDGDDFTQQGGFFGQAFSQTPDPTFPARPHGDLGPRYEIDYTVPGPNNDVFHLKAQLYPYAEGGPVTYMPPGQSFFEGMKTHGGWFRAPAALKDTLVEAGLPPNPPSAVGAGSTPFWRSPGGIALWARTALGARDTAPTSAISAVRRSRPVLSVRVSSAIDMTGTPGWG